MMINLLNSGPRGHQVLLVSARPSHLDMILDTFSDMVSVGLQSVQDAIVGAAKAAMYQNSGVVAPIFATANGFTAHAAVRTHARPANTCWFNTSEFGKKYTRFQRWRVAA